MGGEGPIPFMAIDRYAERYRLSADEFDRFHELLKTMDATWLKLRRDQLSRDKSRG